MKTTKGLFIAAFTMLLFFSTTSFSQDDQQRPEFISVTTNYWNLDNDAGSPEAWAAAEKEYLEKVTSKNEYVTGGSYYRHLLTDNSREVLYIQSYPSWEAMGKAGARTAELEKEAWPDDAERDAFLSKMGAHYSDYHSDEIYATLPGAKVMSSAPEKSLVLYIRKNKMAFPEDGTADEFNTLRLKQATSIYHKNDLIKAYYPSQHAWGSDRRDFIEAFFIESLSDLEAMFDKNVELGEEAMTEAERKAFGKYFKGVHGDYVYSSVKL